jgi:hypothetical protein
MDTGLLIEVIELGDDSNLHRIGGEIVRLKRISVVHDKACRSRDRR